MSATETEIALPHSREAEQCLVAALMMSPELWEQAYEVTPGDFFTPTYRHLFKAMVAVRNAGQPINPITVMEQLRADGTLNNGVNASEIFDYPVGLPRYTSGSDISGFAYVVREKAIQRALIKAGDQVVAQVTDGESSAGAVIEQLEAKLHNLKAAQSRRGLPRLADGVDGYIDEMLNRQESRSLVTFGAGLLDSKIVGPNPGDLIVIGARTSVGKTVLAMQAAVNTAQATHSDHDPVVAFFSLEMNRERLLNRALQTHTGFPVNPWAIRHASSEQLEEIRRAGRALRGLQLFTDETKRLTASAIAAQCAKIRRQTGFLDLVVIDYLQLLEASTKRQSQVAELEDISRNLKIIAGELNCPLIVPAQLNREVAKMAETKPRLDHLRGSGSIEQDADTVILLHRPNGADTATDLEERLIIVAKQRDGWIGEMVGQFDKRNLFIYATEDAK